MDTTRKPSRDPRPTPLFVIERREIVGQVYPGGGDPPITAGFMAAAEYLSREDIGPAATLQFSYMGYTYTASVTREAILV